jgi:hypothetical protein
MALCKVLALYTFGTNLAAAAFKLALGVLWLLTLAPATTVELRSNAPALANVATARRERLLLMDLAFWHPAHCGDTAMLSQLDVPV